MFFLSAMAMHGITVLRQTSTFAAALLQGALFALIYGVGVAVGTFSTMKVLR